MTTDLVLDEANLSKKERKKKIMSSVAEDKCFICIHTDVSSHLS